MKNVYPAPQVPRPAATVMLVREREGGGLLVYLTRRSSRARFMPDAYVFPGGVVDENDRSAELRARLFGSVPGISQEFAIAALRELFEEAGVLIARDAAGGAARLAPADLIRLRERFAQGAGLAPLLESAQLLLDARELIYYSNWITPINEPLRFDTRFFIATAPEQQIASADAIEVHDGIWIDPSEALARADRDELTIRFPTRKHLERLALFDSIDALVAHARARKVVPITPVIHSDGQREIISGAEVW